MPVSIAHLPKSKLLVSFYLLALGAERGPDSFPETDDRAAVLANVQARIGAGETRFERVDLGFGEVFLGVDLSGDMLDLTRYNTQYGQERGMQAVEQVRSHQAYTLKVLKAKILTDILGSPLGRDFFNSFVQNREENSLPGDLTITFARDHIMASYTHTPAAELEVAHVVSAHADSRETGANSPVRRHQM